MNGTKLSNNDRQHLWAEIARTWNVGPGAWWYPLVPTSRIDVVAFEAADFHAAVGTNGLQVILARHHVGRVLYFPEFDEFPAQEIDLDEVDFRYTGAAEGYWCDRNLDWLIYVSHEESITLGGEWLISEIQTVWPQWQDHLWQAGSQNVQQ